MSNKHSLNSATAKNAQQAIDTAIAAGWSPASIRRHGSKAVLKVLGGTVSKTTAGKVTKPKPQPDFTQAEQVSLTADFTPYKGGTTVREAVTGQRGIKGVRGAIFALLTTASGKTFRLSERNFLRLVESKETILTWIGNGDARSSTRVALA